MRTLAGWVFVLLILLPVFSLLEAQDATPVPELTPSKQPATVRVVTGELANVQVYFDWLRQGRAGLIRIAGADVTGVEASVFNQRLDFFRVTNDPGYYALIVAELDQAIHAYEVSVTVTDSAGKTESIPFSIDVDSGKFVQQAVLLTGEKAFLVNPDIESAELAHIFELAAPLTEERLWDDNGFRFPVQAELTSPFGAVRIFNGNFNTLHTGWDFQVSTGIPVVASAAGEVAFAGRMDIRGNYVLINHGYGIYSGYAHLSVIYVTQGQTVAAGQIIGQVGTTGRSSSPHAHFEMLADAQWIDAVDFVRMYMP